MQRARLMLIGVAGPGSRVYELRGLVPFRIITSWAESAGRASHTHLVFHGIGHLATNKGHEEEQSRRQIYARGR